MEKWAGQFTGRELKNLLRLEEGGNRKGYCGHWSPATAIFYLHLERPDPGYLALVEGTASFILKGAERSPEGGLGHWQGSHQLWVDTLYMACPLLAGLGKWRREPAMIGDAARQLLLYAGRLQDSKSGLYYHMWDWETNDRTAGAWGRGNGWVMMSLADTLEAMEGGHRDRKAVAGLAVRLTEALARVQDRDGLWHTVLEDPASYPESSATSMITYGILKLRRLGVLPKRHRQAALKAWNAVNERYVRDGVVTGVSAGTVPRGPDYYRKLPAGTQTWGTGSYLMAGSEVDRLR
jgi:unsaturated rhamnogalacturonyl hydrolase